MNPPELTGSTNQLATLKQAFKFDDNDLALNREGNLSERQIQRIQRLRNQNLLKTLACFTITVLSILLILTAVLLFPYYEIRYQLSDALMATALVAVPLSAAMGIYFLYCSQVWILDTEPGEINSIQGSIKLTRYYAWYAWINRLKIGKQIFRINERQKHILLDDEPYAIYYALRSRIILSIEGLFEAGMRRRPPPPSQPDELPEISVSREREYLGEAFYFDDEALAANQNGQLTDEQFTRLRQLRSRKIRQNGFPAAIYLILWAFISIIGVHKPEFNCVYLWIIGIGVINFNRVQPIVWLAQDLREQRITTIDGKIRLSAPRPEPVFNQHQPVYRLNLRNLIFKLPRRQFYALKNEESYVIYYLPRSREILSIEQVCDNDLTSAN
ncbi:MAG TPA: hypothetical protein VHL11_24980 [Phototrophicaceae bacterium]|nr:hypothetical protein [Phototrophicaceae bacterium]